MINSIKYVDEVIKYNTEEELLNILKKLNPDVRIIGTDWKGKPYTGHELPTKMYWHERNHGWSTSNLRKRVYEGEKINKLSIGIFFIKIAPKNYLFSYFVSFILGIIR